MRNMKNPPLIYSLGMIRFPRLPDIERYIDKFMESIRDKYPIDDRITTKIFNANFTPDGVTINPEETKVWQFASIDRSWGFVLTDQTFCLHTSKYRDYQDFRERFGFGINALRQTPDINIQWIISIGIRYVNMVIAASKSNLTDYLQPWVLAPKPLKVALEKIESVYVSRYKTSQGECRLQVLHNPSFTLPPELNSQFLIKNNWIRPRPDSEFALIDIDHFLTGQQSFQFNVEDILKQLNHLRQTSREVFDAIGTSQALKIWCSNDS
jgi:uncharacterized protein (TIGR04255 family)